MTVTGVRTVFTLANQSRNFYLLSMPPFKRPTAFETSFPDEIPIVELSDSDSTAIDGKRKNDRPVSPVSVSIYG
jgi:hypothetical protein